MEFEEILRERWSCRAYLDEAVPEATLNQMFALAQRTASWCNTQPWHTHLISGDSVGQLSKSLIEHVLTAPMSPDFPIPADYVGVYQERRREAGYALYESLAIERSDRPARDEQMLKNYSFFGAPHVAIITSEKDQGVYGAVDCGGYVANVLNAAHALGLATIPQAAIAMYSGPIREFLDLAEDRLVVCAISLGYADRGHPVNNFRTSRAETSDAVTYLS